MRNIDLLLLKIDEVKSMYDQSYYKILRLRSVEDLTQKLKDLHVSNGISETHFEMLEKYLDHLINDKEKYETSTEQVRSLQKRFLSPIVKFLTSKHGYYKRGGLPFYFTIGLLVDTILYFLGISVLWNNWPLSTILFSIIRIIYFFVMKSNGKVIVEYD